MRKHCWLLTGKGRYRTWHLMTAEDVVLAKVYGAPNCCSYLVVQDQEILLDNTSKTISDYKRYVLDVLRTQYEALKTIFESQVKTVKSVKEKAGHAIQGKNKLVLSKRKSKQ